MDKGKLVSQGKTKSLYETHDPKQLVMHYRDDTTAFNAEKSAKLSNKGAVNNAFNAHIMQLLANEGIKTHFIEVLNERESLVKRLDMLPVESVVRNIATGSLCRRLGIESGLNLQPPIQEFFLKDDDLGDPMINESHMQTFAWASPEEVTQMKQLTEQVNDILTPVFKQAGMILVDYKIEFGRYEGELILGDEFTPDGCRIWDIETRESLDKDRFRQDLGDVVESYQIAAQRLGIAATNTAENII